MKGSDAVAVVLAENNVLFGYELIGGMIAHLVDSINVLGKTRLISMHHEQGAAFAAAGVSRATNNQKLGVALGTSGPGATNLITGIADCWLDSHACIFLTGQVNTYELKKNQAIRQQGFQELDIISLVSSITKYAYQVKNISELIPSLQKAINLSREGRPGPVLLDIPMDIQRESLNAHAVDYLYLADFNRAFLKNNIDLEIRFSQVVCALSESKRPLFLIGGGVVTSPSFNAWLSYISKKNIPHVASLKGSEKTGASDFYFGMIGAYGTRVANYAIQNCDVLVVLGSRMDIRQTGATSELFAKEARIFQIDVDAAQLNNRVVCEQVIHSECEPFLKAYMRGKTNPDINFCYDWYKKLTEYSQATFFDEYSDLSLSPFKIFQTLNQVFKKKEVHYVADVGNNQMWAAHTIKLDKKQAIHHSGGLGAMGFSIPTAIGVQCVTKVPVVTISGDGGAQLNIQELDVIARENLPILILILNNYSLGMVRSFQEMYFEGRNSSTYWGGYSSKYVGIGKAYNVEAYSVDEISVLEKVLKNFIDKPRPLLVEICMKDARECKPRLEFGNPIDQQSPRLIGEL